MPQVEYYEVRQTRVVKVRANTIADAAVVGMRAFDTNGPVEHMHFEQDRVGSTSGDIVTIDLDISKENY